MCVEQESGVRLARPEVAKRSLGTICCLIIGVMLSGCVTGRPAVPAASPPAPDLASRLAEQPGNSCPRWVEYPEWIDNHPILRGVLGGLGVVLICGAVAALFLSA